MILSDQYKKLHMDDVSRSRILQTVEEADLDTYRDRPEFIQKERPELAEVGDPASLKSRTQSSERPGFRKSMSRSLISFKRKCISPAPLRKRICRTTDVRRPPGPMRKHPLPGKKTLPGEQPLPGKKTLPKEQPLPKKEILPQKQPLPGQKTLPWQQPLPRRNSLLIQL